MPAKFQAKRSGSHQGTCSECRRRHQKCISRADGPCLNCLRRYPPPVCSSYVEVPIESRSQGMKHKFPSRARKIIPVETEAPRQDLTDVALLTPESSRAVGGVLSAVNGWNTIAVEPTSRNAELFHFFHEFVVPNLSSIEGTSAPPIYRQNRVPWMIKSPLMPHIAILLASFARCMDRRENVNKCQETLALKVKALALTNEFLAKDFGLIGNDALHAVVHLACLEYIWGQENSMLSHMRGLKEMIRLKGGFGRLTDQITAWVVIMLDFEVAIKFEREIYIQPPELFAFMSRALPGISPAPAYLSPLMASPGTFSQNQETMSHSIAVSTAEILDDISFLVSAITSSPPAPTPKIRGTASWLHSCLQKIDLPTKPTTDDEVVLSVIRHTAIIYTESISTLTPLSYSYSKSLLSELYAHLTFFQPSALRRWNGLPGIFLWILLVACPSSGNDPMGRSLRSKMAATRIVLGLEDYNLPFAYLSSFWRVQRWIDKEREDGELETDALLQSVPEDEP